MSIYRLKTKAEFIICDQWNHQSDNPKGWNSRGGMNRYLGVTLPAEYDKDIEDSKNVSFELWSFASSDFIRIDSPIPEYVRCINAGKSYSTILEAEKYGIKNYAYSSLTAGAIYKLDRICNFNNRETYTVTRAGKGYLIDKIGCEVSTETEYNKQFEQKYLTQFPIQGYCTTLDQNLINYLTNVQEKEFNGYKPAVPIGIAWNNSSYWYVSSSSSKTTYSLQDLSKFITPIAPKLIDGCWYKLPKCSNYYCKYSESLSIVKGRHWCSEYIDDFKRYYNVEGAADFTDAIAVSDSVVDMYILKVKEQTKTLKTIKNEKTSRKTSKSISRESDRDSSFSIKICKPNLEIRTGISIRGIGLKSSRSKIKLGNNHCYN